MDNNSIAIAPHGRLAQFVESIVLRVLAERTEKLEKRVNCARTAWRRLIGKSGASPACVAEVIATLVEANRRLTRDALIAEMKRIGRRRADSTIGNALSLLVRLGLLNNCQDCEPRGYGIPRAD